MTKHSIFPEFSFRERFAAARRPCFLMSFPDKAGGNFFAGGYELTVVVRQCCISTMTFPYIL